jgi:hypothetical protein
MAKKIERTKRLIPGVSADLHKRIKAACVERERLMADVLRELLERHFLVKPSRR